MNFIKTSKREQVITIAKELFLENGYKETSMREIAAKLNIKSAALYNHIESKEEILRTICTDIEERFQEIMFKISNSNDLPKDKLFVFIKSYLQEILNDEAGFEIYLRYRTLAEKINPDATYKIGNFIEFTTKLLHDVGIKNTSNKMTEEAPTLMILNMINQIPKIKKNESTTELDQVVEDFMKILFKGFTISNQ